GDAIYFALARPGASARSRPTVLNQGRPVRLAVIFRYSPARLPSLSFACKWWYAGFHWAPEGTLRDLLTRRTSSWTVNSPLDASSLDMGACASHQRLYLGETGSAHWGLGKNRSISARKCRQAGSRSGSRWLLLSSGTRRLFGISAASNLDCSKRLSGSRREHMISVGTVSLGARFVTSMLAKASTNRH